MCGIFASFNLEKFKELIELNQSRGSFSYSFTMYNITTFETNIFKDFGLFDFNIFPKNDIESIYYIGHVQAPTGGLIKDYNRIHPSILNSTYLYHNGILKDNIINKLKQEYKINNSWDTNLLHHILYNKNIELLNYVDGSFGCLFINNNIIRIFRNDLINLFVDEYFNISSQSFDNSVNINSNIIYNLNFKDQHYIVENYFKTFNNPYFFG